MKLAHIAIKDFRCFGEATFDLMQPQSTEPLELALLVGGNGAGKSSVLQAIAGYFTALAPLYGAAPLGPADIRQGIGQARIEVFWTEGGRGPLGGEGRLFRTSEWMLDRKVGPGYAFSPDGMRGPANDALHWARDVAAPTQDPVGVVALYDVYRLLPPTTVTGPDIAAVIDHRCRDALAPSTRRETSSPYRHAQLKHWIVNLDYWRLKARVDRGQDSLLWETLRKALDTIFSPYTFIGVDDRFNVLFKTPTGTVPIESLSDGFRSVFVIVSDLLLRLSLAAPRPEDILAQEAVCMIDEVDAHLHPRWQERVIPSLRALFPCVQFIATTHSPIVVSTASPYEVFRLEDEVSP